MRQARPRPYGHVTDVHGCKWQLLDLEEIHHLKIGPLHGMAGTSPRIFFTKRSGIYTVLLTIAFASLQRARGLARRAYIPIRTMTK